MKIEISKIPIEGLTEEEDLSPEELDLATPVVAFEKPVHIKVFVRRITNAVNIDALISGEMQLICGRCLEEFKTFFERKFRLNYLVEKNQEFIDLDPDIREELILDYPLNPICKSDCNGLCYKCGKNLNKEQCSC